MGKKNKGNNSNKKRNMNGVISRDPLIGKTVTGTVKYFNLISGYGFVTVPTENGGERDVFIHASNITDGRQFVGFCIGDTVTMNVVNGKDDKIMGCNALLELPAEDEEATEEEQYEEAEETQEDEQPAEEDAPAEEPEDESEYVETEADQEVELTEENDAETEVVKPVKKKKK